MVLQPGKERKQSPGSKAMQQWLPLGFGKNGLEPFLRVLNENAESHYIYPRPKTMEKE